MMALESMNIPIPSEIIMPFSGFLVFNETFNFFGVVLAGTFGNLVGSLVSYYLGFWGGRPFFEKYGKFLLIGPQDIAFADRFFQKYGTIAVLFSRLLPVVRTFISFPAGIAKMNVWKFSLYTFAGSFLWSMILTYGGVVAGGNLGIFQKYFQKFDIVIIGMLIFGGAWYIARHLFFRKKYPDERKDNNIFL